MSKKQIKEFTVNVHWGNIAVVSWGDPENPPVLMVHGYLDSAATFTFLLEHLPDTYYYVAFDMPGTGRSDPFPFGPQLSHLHVVESFRRVVEHMQWKTFICITHSFGFLIGTFYNNIYPGRITKMVCIDPAPTMPMIYYTTLYPQMFVQKFYNKYYKNYDRYRNGSLDLYTHDQILNCIAQNRKLTKQQAEIVMSRSTVPTGDGMFKLSWDEKMKTLPGVLFPEETQLAVIAKNPPPMLMIVAIESVIGGKIYEDFISKFMDKIRQSVPHKLIKINGSHDIHITNPKDMAPYIIDFLTNNEQIFVKAKL